MYGSDSKLKTQKKKRNAEPSATLVVAGNSPPDDSRLSAASWRPPPGLELMRPTAKYKSASVPRRSDYDAAEYPSSSSSQSMMPPPSPGYAGQDRWRCKVGHLWTNKGRVCSICGTRKLKHYDQIRNENFPMKDTCSFCGMPASDHHGYCCTRNQSYYSRNGWRNWYW